MFATDVWLLVAASVVALLLTKVIVYSRFSIGILAQAIIGTLGMISQQDVQVQMPVAVPQTRRCSMRLLSLLIGISVVFCRLMHSTLHSQSIQRSLN